jgi:hypothetical protein
METIKKRLAKALRHLQGEASLVPLLGTPPDDTKGRNPSFLWQEPARLWKHTSPSGACTKSVMDLELTEFRIF